MTGLDNIDVALAPSQRLQYRRNAERLGSDLLPECPSCSDFNPPGATVCGSCGTHLFVRAGRGCLPGATGTLEARKERRAEDDTAGPRPARTYTCDVCLVDSPDSWCSICGKRIGVAA